MTRDDWDTTENRVVCFVDEEKKASWSTKCEHNLFWKKGFFVSRTNVTAASREEASTADFRQTCCRGREKKRKWRRGCNIRLYCCRTPLSPSSSFLWPCCPSILLIDIYTMAYTRTFQYQADCLISPIDSSVLFGGIFAGIDVLQGARFSPRTFGE